MCCKTAKRSVKTKLVIRPCDIIWIGILICGKKLFILFTNVRIQHPHPPKPQKKFILSRLINEMISSQFVFV